MLTTYRLVLLLLCWALATQTTAQELPPAPPEVYGPLFRAVQLGEVFPDAKTFADCVPRVPPADIRAAYAAESRRPGFDLAAFVDRYFALPPRQRATAARPAFRSDTTTSVRRHIDRLWPYLTRTADRPVAGSSLLALPNPYVVPGGRFSEIYYWDSYFTMLGLRRSGREVLIRAMLDNFAFLIDSVGFVPNGNRTYYLSRSQPPFFAAMINLLATLGDSAAVYRRYRSALEKEYAFWMDGRAEVAVGVPYRRVVRLPDGLVLNRYYDDRPRSRPESYREDYALARRTARDTLALYAHLRAACESGWDFSSRWLTDPADLGTIRTAELLPVDLNALLWNLENTLATAARLANDTAAAQHYASLAKQRRLGLEIYCWNDEGGFFTDYDFVARRQVPVPTLATVYPLYFGLATPSQAAWTAETLTERFLRPGGVVTTLQNTGQQWDAPNGWAPLQYLTVRGLERYGHQALADTVRQRWLSLNRRVFRQTGRMMEKYNVEDLGLPAGGGEYPLQDGFGWTNGVFLELSAEER